VNEEEKTTILQNMIPPKRREGKCFIASERPAPDRKEKKVWNLE